MEKSTSFRLLNNDEFDRLGTHEKAEYVRKATEFLALFRDHGPVKAAALYTGPERRQNRPDVQYDGPERRRAA